MTQRYYPRDINYPLAEHESCTLEHYDLSLYARKDGANIDISVYHDSPVYIDGMEVYRGPILTIHSPYLEHIPYAIRWAALLIHENSAEYRDLRNVVAIG